MGRCSGFGGLDPQATRQMLLRPCPSPTYAGEPYCTFHQKVVAGLITDAGRGRALCWDPGRSERARAARRHAAGETYLDERIYARKRWRELDAEQLDRLRREWDPRAPESCSA